MSNHSLADRLYDVCVSSKLAPEHLEVAGLLKQAVKFVVYLDAARTIREELDHRAWSIESNVDLIQWPREATWIEWWLPGRAVEQDVKEGRTGCLIVPHPDHEGLMSVVTAWEEPSTGNVHHCYSTALMELEHLHEQAYLARTRYSKDNEDSFERMISMIGVTLPDGFRDELVLRHKGNAGVVERTMRLGTAEIPYLLALLVARQANGGLAVARESTEDETELALSPPPAKNLMERVEDRLWKRPNNGLFRRVRRRKAVLKWYRPVS